MQASELAAFINCVARLTGSTGLLALREGKPLSRSPMREKGPAPLPQTPSSMEGFPFQTMDLPLFSGEVLSLIYGSPSRTAPAIYTRGQNVF